MYIDIGGILGAIFWGVVALFGVAVVCSWDKEVWLSILIVSSLVVTCVAVNG